MHKLIKSPVILALICSAIVLSPIRAAAEDIDIYTGASAGSSDAPNVMILLDNSPNWSRASQHWPDNGGNQGQAELAAIKSVISDLYAGSQNPNINVGLALLTEYAGTSANGGTPGTGGAYIRFGARDLSVATNRNGLSNILDGIYNNITSPNEKVNGMANKDEAAGFYELYKYFSGLSFYTGDPAQNPNADIQGNANARTAAQQPGISSGWALVNGVYQTPISSGKPCARNFIIYIANNANNIGSTGRSAYQPSVVTVGPAMAATAGINTWTDEWTRYLYMNGVVVPSGSNNGAVATYILDAYNAQQNTDYSASLQHAAVVGGGRYFQVGTQAAIKAALATIFAEIQSINSTFASASLPVNTTTRSQDLNQVFIPMFRPDANAAPRWMGNLKRYQIVQTSGSLLLGDASGNQADNPSTGFLNDCATSFWTSDSGTYWNNVPETPPAKGNCPSSAYSAYSDSPDGPIVEKGGVAEILRKGNNPPTTNTTPTWAVNRTVYTSSGTSLTAFNTTSSGLSASLVNFILGQDANDENGNGNTTETRPSIHGDAVHSRPVPVDYGGSTGVTIYYGANDGTLRAVDASTGKELWAFVAPEFYSRLSRLMANSPLVNYPSVSSLVTPTPQPKDYFFDGSIGLYQNADNSKVWIYPTMRRGGRMIYAFDVTSRTSPTIKWKVGCPNLTNDTGCSAGFTGIGQTWSKPQVAAAINGYDHPVVIVGGGYDTCEDANSATPSCGSTKGGVVYVLDAETGAIVQSFSTTRSVVADVALISLTTAGKIDHAYAVDTGGNIYRLDFGTTVASWTMNRVAYTNGGGRKFFFTPALLGASSTKIYVALGSGDREHPLQSHYPYGNVTNRFYVYMDNVNVTTATNLDDTALMSDFSSATTCDTAGVLPNSVNKKGWFMNLPNTGEQTISSALIVGGMVTFNTNYPVPPAQGTCSTSLGAANGYWLNLFNASGGIGVTGNCGGTRSGPFSSGGMPPSPVIGVVPVNGVNQTIVIGAARREGGSTSVVAPQNPLPQMAPKKKLIYWKSSDN
jgi:type IV pilus assembly protein PilY1